MRAPFGLGVLVCGREGDEEADHEAGYGEKAVREACIFCGCAVWLLNSIPADRADMPCVCRGCLVYVAAARACLFALVGREGIARLARLLWRSTDPDDENP